MASPNPARSVAAFDFDGTLTRRDTLVPFLARVSGWPLVVAATLPVVPELVRALAGRGDRDAAKARVFARLFTGRPYDPIRELGATYGNELARDKIRPEVRARLDWHRARAHEVVIVSASLAVYLETVGAQLGVDRVISTELEVDAGGNCTGRMLDGNCRGPEKARRLQDCLGMHAGDLWVYGDSAGDTEMLAMADHPVRVHRSHSFPAIPTA